jgi:hypothetical protein
MGWGGDGGGQRGQGDGTAQELHKHDESPNESVAWIIRVGLVPTVPTYFNL